MSMGVKARRIALRPFLPADTAVLAALFRTSIEELTGDDYDVDQQEAWAAAADDEAAFGEGSPAFSPSLPPMRGRWPASSR